MSGYLGSIGSADGGGVAVSVLTIPVGLACPATSTVLIGAVGGGGHTILSVTDTQGNTYVIDPDELNTGANFYALGAHSILTNALGVSDSITITFSGSNKFNQAAALLYSEMTPDVQAVAESATGSTAPSSGATPATNASVEVVIGILAVGGANSPRPTFTPASGYTTRASHTVNDGSASARDLYIIEHDTTVAGAQTASGTLSISETWAMTCVAFRLPSGPTQTINAGFGGSATGAQKLGFGLRSSGPDITGDAAAYPWASVVSALDYWKNVETVDNTFTFSQFDVSFKYAIDNGIKCGLRIEMAYDGIPTWAWSANSLGAGVQHLTTYTGPSDTTGEKTPVPWDPTLRKLWQRLCRRIQAFLQTSYNGKTYAQVCAFVSVSGPTALPGTEMTIGDEGDTRNTANWNAVLNGQTARRAAYITAWQNCTLDALTNISGVDISVAQGTVWSDGRAGFMGMCDWMVANLTKSQLARVICGPTDMRVDQPGAVSYAAWSAAADTAMKYTLSKGIRTWAQSAGWSWWGLTFDGGTLAAIQTAYLADAVDLYACDMVESNTQILGNVAGLPSWCEDTLQPAIKAQTTSTTTTAYEGDYGADTGGGFNESCAQDSQTSGQYLAGADTWGMRLSTDHGNDWWGCMSGLAWMSQPPHTRACFFSKRPATAGVRFLGVGGDASGGDLYYGLPGDLAIHAMGTTIDFSAGLATGAGVNGTARRPCGQWMDSYVDGSGNEYMFCLTNSGLNMFKNDSSAATVAEKIAAIPTTPTTLLGTSAIGAATRLFVEVLDATRIVIINWDHHLVNGSLAVNPTDVYIAYTTATDWSGATPSNTHAIGPLTIAPPKGRVYEIHRGNDGVIHAAAGYDGAYTVTLTGTGASSAFTWTSLSMPNDLLVCSIDSNSAGVIVAGQTAGATGGTSYSNSSTGMTAGHSVAMRSAAGVWSWPASGSAVKLTEFQPGDTTAGTGRTWWLENANVVLSQPAHDVSMIRFDPFDDNRILVHGRAGTWQSRDGGASWYPAMRGMNGGQTISAPAQPIIRATGGSNVTGYNHDFGGFTSSDDMETCAQSGFATGSGGVAIASSGTTTLSGLDGHSYTFTSPTASAPAKLTRDGVKISDQYFEGAIVAPVAMCVTKDGTVCILQNGGGTFTMRLVSSTTTTTTGAQAYGADVAYSGGTTQSIAPDFVQNDAVVNGPTISGGTLIIYAGTA